MVAGEKKAIEALSAAAAEGAKRVIPLNVVGAFHSPLMKEAAVQMKQRIEPRVLSAMRRARWR